MIRSLITNIITSLVLMSGPIAAIMLIINERADAKAAGGLIGGLPETKRHKTIRITAYVFTAVAIAAAIIISVRAWSIQNQLSEAKKLRGF